MKTKSKMHVFIPMLLGALLLFPVAIFCAGDARVNITRAWAAPGGVRAMPAADPELPASLGITAESAIVISANTGVTLAARNENCRRAIASTVKIMTALLAIEHAQQPGRSLDDWVTIGDYPLRIEDNDNLVGWQLYPNGDRRAERLQIYEQVRLRDLLYASLLRSSPDATRAIAEHVVGQISNSSNGERIEQDFVRLMNNYAWQLGLYDTQFRNSSGRDPEAYEHCFPTGPCTSQPNCGHYSTARDLAELARVALRNPTFASIVRTRTWSFQSIGRTARGYWPKLYTEDYALENSISGLFYDTYPGANGVKPGNSGQAGPTMVASATLLGKSVIAVVIKSAVNPDHRFEDSRRLLDYGFDVLFNVNRQDDASQTGVIFTPQITALSPDRVVTAVRDSEGSLKVTGWTVSALGAITHADTDIDNLTGRVSEIAIDTVGADKVVTAVRAQNGRLKLITWSVDDHGMVARLGDSGDLGQAGSKITLQTLALSTSRAVTAMKNANGDLELTTWEMDAGGSWTDLHSVLSYTANEIGMTNYCRNCAPDVSDPPTYRVLTGVKDNAAHLKLISWNIDANGNIAQHLESTAAAQCTSQIALNYQKAYDKERIITAVRNSSGNLELITWRFNNGQIERLADSGTQAGQTLNEIRLTGLANPGWLMTAVQTSSGNLKLISWRFTREGELTRFIDSGSQAGSVSKIALCQLTGNTFVTAVKASDGTLKLISWKVE